MPEYATRRSETLLTVADDLEREFEVHVTESSTLAFRVAFGVLRQREDAEDVAPRLVQGVPKINDIPSFRTFQFSNTVILKDGQSTEFTAASDRINGEVTKVDVTLTVLK